LRHYIGAAIILVAPAFLRTEININFKRGKDQIIFRTLPIAKGIGACLFCWTERKQKKAL
jgi:hypothetical protein